MVPVYVDDMTGKEVKAVETVRFGVDGLFYEIDLEPKGAAKLRDTVAEYVAAARKIRKDAMGTTGTRVPDPETKIIRSWWEENAGKVNIPYVSRGRIPYKVMDAYRSR